MVEEFGATRVLDVGCGTGTLACLLAEKRIVVVGVDPALASLEVAKVKVNAERVRWIHGEVTDLPPLAVDLATMTANVAQVFLDDAGWAVTLNAIAGAVNPSGRLVFETRRPEGRAWENWNRDQTWQQLDVPDVGLVETWTDLVDVSLPLVSFRDSFHFHTDDSVLVSGSTLRFRDLEELDASLSATGWQLDEVRDAPDRPGREYVCIASRR